MDLNKLKRYPLTERRNLVDLSRFGTVEPPGEGVAAFWDNLPDLLGASSLKELARGIASAHGRGAPCWTAFGGHVVKVGVGPHLIDLMERGLVTGIATHGAGAIHDVEIALIGATSEDVGESLQDGSFGMARETTDFFNETVRRCHRDGVGLGRALGEALLEANAPHADRSLLACAARLGKPATVHVALGTDIVHMGAEVDGAAWGAATMEDFRVLTRGVAELEGGIWLNLGSAVLLPEVFLKALTIARNLQDGAPHAFTTANLDMIQHYRGRVNVIGRPSGHGIAIVGQHEILVPLLHQGILIEQSRLGEAS
ncbi:MAG: hypothetical protein RL885_30555 [Planctomycetota bacterium]